MERRRLLVVSLLVLLVVPLALAGGKGEKSVRVTEPESWWAKAAEPYRGMVLNGVTEATPPNKYLQLTLAKKFTEETGIKINLEVTSWDAMFDKEIKDMETGAGIYDFVYVEQDIIYSYLERDFLVNLSDFMAVHPELVYPNIDMDDFTNVINYFQEDNDPNGDLFCMPFEAFLKLYVFRTDLFNNPEIKAAFKDRYGWDLRPAKTPSEYTQISKFFTQWGRGHDLKLWGTVLEAGAHPAGTYDWLLNHLGAWGVNDWGINTKNWKATETNGGALDSKAAKDSLRWWIDLIQYGPPETSVSTWDEVTASFAGGRAAQGFLYCEELAWLNSDSTRSTIIGKIGVANIPALPEVFERVDSGKGGYIGYYDAAGMGIPYSSKNKEAAFLFIQYLTRQDLQPDFTKASTRVVRYSTFDEPVVKQMDRDLGGYFTLMREQGHLYAGSPPFPFHSTIFEIIYQYVLKAVAGELTVDEALDEAAKDVDSELVNLGYATK